MAATKKKTNTKGRDKEPKEKVNRDIQSNILEVAKIEEEQKEDRSPGEKLSELIAAFCGSMTFVYVHVVWFGGWIVLNSVTKTLAFDPFPYTFLTLVVSLEAIFLSTFILISQNHETKLTERRNNLDLQINMLAEQENTKMLELVRSIAEKVGVDCDDPSLEALTEEVKPQELLEEIIVATAEDKESLEEDLKSLRKNKKMIDQTADRLDERTPSLHTPEHREKGTALLKIDMIGDFSHKGGDELARNALPAASNIARLMQRAQDARIPVIYVNDNFGEWRNDFQATLECARSSEKGGEIVKLIEPTEDDYHVLKPQRSGFFSTPLDVLLATLKVSELILVGAATDICILFTAHDAYMRGYHIFVPPDCTAAATTSQHREAIALLQRLADADTRLSEKIILPSADR